MRKEAAPDGKSKRSNRRHGLEETAHGVFLFMSPGPEGSGLSGLLL